MKRTNIYLLERQLDVLRRVGEARGRPVAELVRDAVEAWLESQGVRAIPEDEWTARFDALIARRHGVADRQRSAQRFTEEGVLRDALDAVRTVRRKPAARRR